MIRWLWLVAGIGCSPGLGRLKVTYGSTATTPLVHTESDPHRWYIPADSAIFGDQVFFFDTGYGVSTCDDDLIKTLDLKVFGHLSIRGEAGTVHARKARLPDFKIGNHVVSGLICAVRDLNSTSSIRDSRDVPIAGVPGADVFRRFTVRIDPATASVQWSDPTHAIPAAVAQTPLRRESPFSPRFHVNVGVDTRDLRVLVDTGASDSWFDGEAAGSTVIERKKKVNVLGSGKTGGKAKDLVFYEANSIRLGSEELTGLRFIGRQRHPGLLGLSVLKNYTQTYDFKRKRLYLDPVKPQTVPSWTEWQTSAAILEK